MFPVLFHEAAEAELNEAAAYYESNVTGLGNDFLTEVEHTIKNIQRQPEASSVVLSVVRKKVIRRFPYSVMYSLTGNAIYILAIASQKRRPFYWYARKM